MDNDKISEMMKRLLADPAIGGDYKKALFVACGAVDEVAGVILARVEAFLPKRRQFRNAIKQVHPKYGLGDGPLDLRSKYGGRPRRPDHWLPERFQEKRIAGAALEYAKLWGEDNYRVVAERYMREIFGVGSPDPKDVATFQKLISAASPTPKKRR